MAFSQLAMRRSAEEISDLFLTKELDILCGEREKLGERMEYSIVLAEKRRWR